MIRTVPTSEAQFQGAVEELARLLGYSLQYHTRFSIRSPSGFPDLVLVNPGRGRMVILELKSTRGTLNPAQGEWLAGLRACGVEAYAAWPEDFYAVQAGLESGDWTGLEGVDRPVSKRGRV